MKFTVLKIKKRLFSWLSIFPYAVTVQLDDASIITINSRIPSDDTFLLHVKWEIEHMQKESTMPTDSALKIKSVLNHTFDTSKNYRETASTIEEGSR